MQFLPSDRGAILHALSVAGLPTPKAITAAEALVHATEQHLGAVRAETEPNLDNLTPANVADVAERVALWHRKEDRERAAVIVSRHAENALDTTWMAALDPIAESLRAPFDKAADTFVTALTTLDYSTEPGEAMRTGREKAYRALTAAAAVLTPLSAARDIIAAFRPTGITHHGLDQLGRVLELPDMHTVGRVIPVHVGGSRPHSTEWFAAVAQVPGVRIRWALPNEQQGDGSLRSVAAA